MVRPSRPDERHTLNFLEIPLVIVSLTANSYAFYPEITVRKIEEALDVVLPMIQPWAIKFATYLFSCNIILSLGCRAGGRFSNQALYNAFIGKNKEA